MSMFGGTPPSLASYFSGWDGVTVDTDVLTGDLRIGLTVSQENFEAARTLARLQPHVAMRQVAEHVERRASLSGLRHYGRKRR